jgi:DNA-binding XRE family transcriptional regulator
MQFRPQEYSPKKSRNRFMVKTRSRKEDALRRLFSIPCSPEAKADIAMHFKDLRRKVGLTQLDLGRNIGLCRQSVSEIENCRVWPHYTTLDRFCDLEAKCFQSQVRFPEHWQ